MGKQARAASKALSRASTEQKNEALLCLADRLISANEVILSANRQDVGEAERSGLSAAMIDRLTLNLSRLEGIAEDLRKVVGLPDPVGESSSS
jgi:glutamate-5-semialdehyde dehydrogenase